MEEQYKDSTNLNQRIHLYDKFSKNRQDWHLWLFEQYRIPNHGRILELGCGSGIVWIKNKLRMLKNWDLTLSDFSPGMLEDARKNIGELIFSNAFFLGHASDFISQAVEGQGIRLGNGNFFE